MKRGNQDARSGAMAQSVVAPATPSRWIGYWSRCCTDGTRRASCLASCRGHRLSANKELSALSMPLTVVDGTSVTPDFYPAST